jgi:hypothetical protein
MVTVNAPTVVFVEWKSAKSKEAPGAYIVEARFLSDAVSQVQGTERGTTYTSRVIMLTRVT